MTITEKLIETFKMFRLLDISIRILEANKGMDTKTAFTEAERLLEAGIRCNNN